MRVAGVVLAAGSSRRLGEPKQGLRLGGETLLARAVRVALEAGLEPLYLVLSPGRNVVDWVGNVDGFRVLINEGAEEGMASSIRLGVGAVLAGDVEGVVVMACDQPAVTAAHLKELMASGASGSVVASGYAGRRGVPAYFPASSVGALLELRGDVGARELLRGAGCVELVGGELDVDTVGDLEKARELFG